MMTSTTTTSTTTMIRRLSGLLDPDEQELVIEEAGRWAKAFGIGGSDAE